MRIVRKPVDANGNPTTGNLGIYTAEEFHVNYAAGTSSSVSNMPATSAGVTEGEKVSASSTIPSRSSYTFLGWKYNEDTTVQPADGTSITMPHKDINLTAQWMKSSFNVKYNSNGGPGTMLNSTITYGSS